MDGLRRGPWSGEEDLILMNYIDLHGEGRWNSLALSTGLKRTGKSCRLRWLNYLCPRVRRGNITLEEQLLILKLQFEWGNKWSKIAQCLPGRTDNEIKNYWRTWVHKLAKQLKCEVNSEQFKDIMINLWMPILAEKIQAANAAASTGAATSSTTTTIITYHYDDRRDQNIHMGLFGPRVLGNVTDNDTVLAPYEETPNNVVHPSLSNWGTMINGKSMTAENRSTGAAWPSSKSYGGQVLSLGSHLTDGCDYPVADESSNYQEYYQINQTGNFDHGLSYEIMDQNDQYDQCMWTAGDLWLFSETALN